MALELPILPLRDVVVYPSMVMPLFVGRRKSIKALEQAMLENEKKVLLVTQKNAAEDDPKAEDLFHVGTIATVLQLLKLPDGTVKVLVEGSQRARIEHFIEKENYLSSQAEPLIPASQEMPREAEILSRALMAQFDQFVKLNKKIPPEVLPSLSSIEDPSRLADNIAAHLPLKIEEKQQILESVDLVARLEKLMNLIGSEIDILQVAKRVHGRVKRQMEKKQREFYLNEQMDAIKKELGELSGENGDVDQLAQKIKEAQMPEAANEKATGEFNKLKMMSPMSAEATVIRNYLDWMVKVPWKTRSKIRYNLAAAKKVLDQDHYGLEEVKERIIEYLAVQQRVKELKGPILCLVGPPGVGKTSLGQSIANATGRKFVRIALGGVRDEAEIRGHRRTYIGSMPGKIIQQLVKVGVRNPLIMLDEIDKMSMDFRGDPASALLEVLDPEQNHTFADHYLEVDYDLSETMFITTANTLDMPAPLLDRMEIIRLPGYTEHEKVNIATQYLIPKQMKQNGASEKELHISPNAVLNIIRYYTREAGVRNLDRDLAKVCRKVVKQFVGKESKKEHVTITGRNLEKYLGAKRYRYGLADSHDQVGQVNGLAWTSVGGELLTIEATAMAGKGNATYTGQLGNVMQESIKTAMTVVRSRAEKLGIPKDFYEKTDIHVHVPEGATPKDGPSAGIGMATALASVLTGIPVRAAVAMTGEITLRGDVLPIGGLKEKLLAAQRGRIVDVIIPLENKRDLADIPQNVKHGLNIHPVSRFDEVIKIALARQPIPLPTTETKGQESEVKQDETKKALILESKTASNAGSSKQISEQ